ncbi:single-stranded DNA-binding protein [Oleidesulfovibrio sp.]|uniref:single-stranded DNA-binding protein n=1 Tax=Oleidesulfovibrio sp. TaxID=2909707 RepID=UPI003A845692
MSLNKVMIIGRLGADPELKYTQSGTPVARLRIATSETYTDREGNRQETTEWHTVVVFQRQAENCANYLSKGSMVYVEGSITTRQWQDKDGQNRYATEIKGQRVQFLDRKSDSAGASGQGQKQGRNNGQQSQSRYTDDDLGPALPSEQSGMDDVPF